jgi:competence protein ComEC
MKKNYPQPIIKRPLAGSALKASAFFSLGILTAAQNSPNLIVSGIILAAAISLTLFFSKREWIGDILACFTLTAAGIFAFSAQGSVKQPILVPPHFKFNPVKVEGILYGDARIQSGNTFVILSCKKISTDSTEFRSGGLLPCVLYNRSLFLTDGARVILRGSIKSIRHPFEPLKLWHVPGKVQFTDRLTIDSSPLGVIITEKGGYFPFLRTTLSNLMNRYDFMGQNGLLQALTIGDLRYLLPETRAEFTQTGIAHLLAVSGMNVGVLAVSLNFLLTFLSIGKSIRLLIVIFLLFLYTGICGFQPPITRAFIMAVILMGAQSFERRPDTEHTLFLAMLFILALDPGTLGGASLQLSFTAVWALITFYTPIMNWSKGKLTAGKYIKPVWGLIVATLLCTVATAPIVAAHFGSIPFLSLPVNIPAVPLASMITVLGMLTTGLIALGTLVSPIAQFFVFITGILLTSLSHLAVYASAIPLASLNVGAASPLFGIGIISFLYILSRSRGRDTFIKALLYLPLTFALLATWAPVAGAFQEKEDGTAIFFDVGQGDATLVRFPGGQNFLVDTGPYFKTYTAAESFVIPGLRNAGVKGLDGVFLTHMDSDHSGGLDAIMKNFPVKRLYCTSSVFDSLRKLYDDKTITLGAGDSLSFQGGGITILSSQFHSNVHSKENNSSLVLRFNLEKCSVLFTGDIENDMQRALLPWGAALHADVLKIPHHGAAGLDSFFVKAVNPKRVIISCGIHNRYGHPASSTLTLLNKFHCIIHRTDSDGNIILHRADFAPASDGSF